MELGRSCQCVSCTSPLYCNDLSGSVLRLRPNLNVHLLQVFTTLSLQTKWIKTAQQASSSGVGILVWGGGVILMTCNIQMEDRK